MWFKAQLYYIHQGLLPSVWSSAHMLSRMDTMCVTKVDSPTRSTVCVFRIIVFLHCPKIVWCVESCTQFTEDWRKHSETQNKLKLTVISQIGTKHYFQSRLICGFIYYFFVFLFNYELFSLPSSCPYSTKASLCWTIGRPGTPTPPSTGCGSLVPDV